MNRHKLTTIDPTLTVLHLGGRGGVGPTSCLFRLGESLSLSIFEANIEPEDSSWANYDSLIKEYATRYGIKLSIVPQCLSNTIGKKEFHINVMPDCSSLLKMSPDAKNYQRINRGKCRIIWGQICQPKRSIEIDVTTLDALCANNVIQIPHFITMDVQGAEYDILEGASEALRGDLLGVISEVEFRELYDRQKLFTDQYTLLRQHEFNLFDLIDTEYWYSGPIIGKGELVVAEALFLRDFRYFVRKNLEPAVLLSNLSKLAIIAYCFGRQSYAFEIMGYIMHDWEHEWGILIQESNTKYLYDLIEFYLNLRSHPPETEKLPTYVDFLAGDSSNEYLDETASIRGNGFIKRGVHLSRKFMPRSVRHLVRSYLVKSRDLIDMILKT